MRVLGAGLRLLPLPARGRHREVNTHHGAGTTGLEKTLVSIPWGKRATKAPDKLGFAFSKGFRLCGSKERYTEVARHGDGPPGLPDSSSVPAHGSSHARSTTRDDPCGLAWLLLGAALSRSRILRQRLEPR